MLGAIDVFKDNYFLFYEPTVLLLTSEAELLN